MRKIIIIALLLLVVGFYFFPSGTKDLVDSTGHVIKDTSKNVYQEIKGNEELKETVSDVKDNIKDTFSDENKTGENREEK